MPGMLINLCSMISYPHLEATCWMIGQCLWWTMADTFSMRTIFGFNNAAFTNPEIVTHPSWDSKQRPPPAADHGWHGLESSILSNNCRLAHVIHHSVSMSVRNKEYLSADFTMVEVTEVGNPMGVTPSRMICHHNLLIIFYCKHRIHVDTKAATNVTCVYPSGKTSGTQLIYVDLSWDGKSSHFVRYDDCMCMAPIKGYLHTLNAPDHVCNRQSCRFPRDGFPDKTGNLQLDMLMFVPTIAIIPHLVMKNSRRCPDWRIH